MAKNLKAIDISKMPDLLRIAEEVGKSGEARVLRSNAKDIAIVMPLGRRRAMPARPLSNEARDAFRAAAGGWKDVDAEALLQDVYRNRRLSDRSPIDL